jgi:putative RecB family exonuclease
MELWELRKKPHLSASAIGDYVECGLLFKFGRVDKLPMEYKPDALEFGSVIHKVLEEYYREKMIGNLMSLKDIHKSFEELWTDAAEDRDDIQYKKGKDFKALLMDGKDLLTAWHNKLSDDGYRVLAIEEAFSFHLPGIPIPVIGGIDLVEEDDAGTIIVTDFKTSSKSYSVKDVDQNQQLTTYQMAIKSNGFSDREILLKFDCLIKTKAPKFESYYTTRSDLDERRFTKKIQVVWNGIQKGVFVPNDTSWKCGNCSYKKACDDWFKGKEVK